MGFTATLGLIFITLKLITVITWPWIWVLAPIWIPLAVVATIAIISAAIAGMVVLFARPKSKTTKYHAFR